MKKFLKYCLINVIFVILILLFIEGIFFFKRFNIEYNISYKETPMSFKEKCVILNDFFFNSYTSKKKDFKYINKSDFRKVEKSLTENNKPAIMLLGCSYTYGTGLKENEVFSSILFKETNRTIYNLGITSGSPAEALYLLRNPQIRKEIVGDEEPIEFVIFTYIPGHEKRLFTDTKVPKFKAIKKDTQLVPANSDLLFKNHTFQYFVRNSKLGYKIVRKRIPIISNLYFQEIRKEVYKNFPNSKFIILVYDYVGIDNRINNFELGIYANADKVLVLNDIVDIDLTSLDYKGEDKIHPNVKAWDHIVPALVKELNL